MDELGGITTMLPTEDAEWVGAELTRRFGMTFWSFTLSATDANRWAIRLARLVTGKPKVLVLQLLLPRLGGRDVRRVGPDGGRSRARATSLPRSPLDLTTRVVPWNDLELGRGEPSPTVTSPRSSPSRR